MNGERFFKLAEVQQMLGVSRSTIWRWQAERGLKVVHIGAVARIRESDLQAFLKRHEARETRNSEGQKRPACLISKASPGATLSSPCQVDQ